jgi:hypothetical protein
MKIEKLLFIGWTAYGDILSYNGLIRTLLKYVDKLYFRVDGDHLKYAKNLFNNEDRIIILSKNDSLRLILEEDDLYVLNSVQSVNFDESGVISKVDSDEFKDLVDGSHFINGINKLSNYIEFEENEIQNNLNYIDNASNFYVNLGLNPELRYLNFFYNRKVDEEEKLKNELLLRNGIQPNEEFDIICEMPNNKIRDEYKSRKCINIHHCTDNPLNLISLFESSTDIHLVEDSHTLFLYYLCMSEIINIKSITIHLYARNRFEYYYKMFMNPISKNWKFIW